MQREGRGVDKEQHADNLVEEFSEESIDPRVGDAQRSRLVRDVGNFDENPHQLTEDLHIIYIKTLPSVNHIVTRRKLVNYR